MFTKKIWAKTKRIGSFLDFTLFSYDLSTNVLKLFFQTHFNGFGSTLNFACFKTRSEFCRNLCETYFFTNINHPIRFWKLKDPSIHIYQQSTGVGLGIYIPILYIPWCGGLVGKRISADLLKVNPAVKHSFKKKISIPIQLTII